MFHRIDTAECDFKFKVEAHFAHPEELKHVSLKMLDKTGLEVATLRAMIFNRYLLKTRFHQTLDEDDDETAEFSQKLFDKFGCIQRLLIDDEYHKGTGVWGTELDQGMIIYIFGVYVKDAQCERQGVGSSVLQHFLQSKYVEKDDIVFCWPSPGRKSVIEGPKELWTPEFEIVVSFFRQNGFRRVGRTVFFAYSPDNDHPSRRLTITEDIKEGTGVGPAQTALTPEERIEAYPLHALICDRKDATIEQAIRDMYTASPDCIRIADDLGITPIFMAVDSGNLVAVQTLISLGVSDDLLKRNPVNGSTPLEICRGSMESTRKALEVFDLWDGYAENKLMIEAALKRSMGLSINMTNEEYVQKNRYGCTCGECTQGWLSPRMRFRLIDVAESSADMMATGLELSAALGKPLETFMLLDNQRSFLPLPLHCNFKTFYSGYRHLFLIVAHLFKGGVPTIDYVNEELVRMRRYESTTPIQYIDSRAVEFYTNKGGRAEYVLDCITSSAMENSADAGDGEFERTMDEGTSDGTPDSVVDTYIQRWQELPRCDNDREYDLVRRMLGMDPMRRWGPYRLATNRHAFDFGSDLETDTDEEEEDEEVEDNEDESRDEGEEGE